MNALFFLRMCHLRPAASSETSDGAPRERETPESYAAECLAKAVMYCVCRGGEEGVCVCVCVCV